MSATLTCSQGHEWNPDSSLSRPHLCPVCGSAPLTQGPPPSDGQDTIPEIVRAAPFTLGGQSSTTDVERYPSVPGHDILGVLGRGGMGVVYKARQVKLKRLVALKMILAGEHAGPKELERFRIEAEAVARLQHPNIVQIHDVGEHEGRPFFSLEFVEGGSLAQKLAGTPQAARESASLVETLARAIHVAHQRGIVHRDCKPANILLTADGVPKITDFGLAKQLDSEHSQTQSGAILGTPSYMAPEQALGDTHTIGPAADIYALGAILYEMLTGRPPFRADTPMNTLFQVTADEPVPPRRLQSQVPRDLETICLKCLQKPPGKRYATALDLAEDLRRFQDNEPIQARPIRTTERLWRWCRRKPALAGTAAVAVLALLGTLITLTIAVVLVSQARDKEHALRQQAVRDATKRLVEESLIRCEHQDAGHGMLWLARSLEQADQVEDSDLESFIRLQLAAWSNELHSLKAVFPHQDRVNAVAYSPDGKIVLTGSKDRTAQLWDAATGQPLRSPLRHDGEVNAVAFSPDGNTVLTGCGDKTARLWDVATGRPIGSPLQHGDRVIGVAFSPDGDRVVTGSVDKTARIWKRGSAMSAVLLIAHQDRVSSVASSPDGKTILTGCADSTARLWDASTGQPLGLPLVHQAQVEAVAFSPDGKRILTGSADKTARLWETASCRPLGPPLMHDQGVAAVAFSLDGEIVLTGSSDRTARLWNVATCKQVGSPLWHKDAVTTVTFSPDGKAVLTGSVDKAARLWEVGGGRSFRKALVHGANIGTKGIAFSPDGLHLATGGSGTDKTIKVWDLVGEGTPRTLEGHTNGGIGVAFSPNGDLLASGSADKNVKIWDVVGGQELRTLRGHTIGVNSVAFSPDGKRLASGSGDNTVRIWNLAGDREPITLTGHTKSVLRVAFSPDGKTILTGSDDQTARLWDAANGQPLGMPIQHQGLVYGVGFSPDGRTILTGSRNGIARQWDAATLQPLGPPLPHPAGVESVAFSPDGQLILTGCRDRSARLWDTAGRLIGPPLRHADTATAVAFSPDGKLFATGCWDGVARIWERPMPVEGSVERVVLWVQILTGMELDSDNLPQVLDAEQWQQRRKRLQELGGPPVQ